MEETDQNVVVVDEWRSAPRSHASGEKLAAVGHEAVLLVEDDPPIRQLVRWELKRLGYGLLEACDGREALDALTKHQGRVDLLLTDVVMPGMDGFQLAECVAKRHPETKVLFVTAYVGDSIAVRGGLKETGHAFLVKPFTAAELAVKIRELLDGLQPAPLGGDAAPRAVT